VLPRRSPGHRGQDQRDTVAEMIQKAHEISLEAGSKMATAMKDVIFAAAGLTPFAAESAKDLVNYMVRRGQMGAEEAERILKDIEAAAEKRGGPRPAAKPPVKDEPRFPASSALRPAFVPAASHPPMQAPVRTPSYTPMHSPTHVPQTPLPANAMKKPAAPAKPAAKKPAAKKAPAAKKPAVKKSAKKK
jgi:polyhydroxyalkanoate synthesis regulator phasin